MRLKTQTWWYLLLITFIIVPVANYLPIVIGVTQDRFANDVTTRVDAADYAFSIWGVIFTGMLVFAILQLNNKSKSKDLKRAYIYLLLAGLASIAFVPISIGDNPLLVFVDLVAHLAVLIAAHLALRAHVDKGGKPSHGWSYFAPSMYLGWISTATVISAALALDYLGLGFEPPVAIVVAFVLQLVLIAIGVYLTLRKDVVFGLTVAWALVAVAIKQQDADLLFWGGVAGAIFLGTLAVVRVAGRKAYFYATSV